MDFQVKVVKKVLIGIAAAPFVILLGAIALPVIFVMETKASISLRAFRRREAGHVCLVCTSRLKFPARKDTQVLKLQWDVWRYRVPVLSTK